MLKTFGDLTTNGIDKFEVHFSIGDEKDVGSELESSLLGGLRVRGSAGADKFSCRAFVVVSSQKAAKEVSDLKPTSVWHTAPAALKCSTVSSLQGAI